MGLRVRNPKKLVWRQMDFSNSRYSSLSGQRVNTGKMQDLCLKAAISMLFLFFIFLQYMYRKVWMLAF